MLTTHQNPSILSARVMWMIKNLVFLWRWNFPTQLMVCVNTQHFYCIQCRSLVSLLHYPAMQPHIITEVLLRQRWNQLGILYSYILFALPPLPLARIHDFYLHHSCPDWSAMHLPVCFFSVSKEFMEIWNIFFSGSGRVPLLVIKWTLNNYLGCVLRCFHVLINNWT